MSERPIRVEPPVADADLVDPVVFRMYQDVFVTTTGRVVVSPATIVEGLKLARRGAEADRRRDDAVLDVSVGR